MLDLTNIVVDIVVQVRKTLTGYSREKLVLAVSIYELEQLSRRLRREVRAMKYDLAKQS